MKIFIFLSFMVISFVANSQTTRTKATANANVNANMNANVNANVNTTVSSTTSNSETKSTKTSVSVQNSDDSYSFYASFDNFKRQRVEKLLMQNLEKNYLIKKGAVMIWKKEDNGEVAYSFTLSDEKLKVNVDKELVSKDTFEKIKSLGEKISNALTEKEK